MSQFTGSLIIEEVAPGRLWRLVQPVRFEADFEGSGRWIEVPTGFETDGASLPKFLRVFLAVWGTYGRAAVLHDYLYGLIADLDRNILHPELAWSGYGDPSIFLPGMNEFIRKWADDQFYLAMKALGTSSWLASLMFVSVRWFGAGAIKS
jgi:Protein of unknown function (DUF1353)